jgi:hypothetical protein
MPTTKQLCREIIKRGKWKPVMCGSCLHYPKRYECENYREQIELIGEPLPAGMTDKTKFPNHPDNR